MGLIQECGKWIAEGGDRMSIVPWKPIDELTTMRRDLDILWDRFFPENFSMKGTLPMDGCRQLT